MGSSKGTKETVIVLLFLFFGFPPLLKAILWSQKAVNSSPTDSFNQLPDIILENTLPWWLDTLVYLAGLGTLGAFLIIGFVYFLRWADQM